MLTTVAVFRDPWEAHMFRSLLDWEGVPAVVSHAYHVGNNWPWSTGLGGVKVQVPRDHAERAFDIERLCRAGHFHAALRTELGDIDDPHCPHCGSVNFRKRRPIGVIVFVVVALFLVGAIPAFGWVCFCRSCGTKFVGQE